MRDSFATNCGNCFSLVGINWQYFLHNEIRVHKLWQHLQFSSIKRKTEREKGRLGEIEIEFTKFLCKYILLQVSQIQWPFSCINRLEESYLHSNILCIKRQREWEKKRTNESETETLGYLHSQLLPLIAQREQNINFYDRQIVKTN